MAYLEYLLATIADPILSVILAHRLDISMKRGQWNFILGKRTSPGYLGLNIFDFPYDSFCYNYFFSPRLLNSCNVLQSKVSDVQMSAGHQG